MMSKNWRQSLSSIDHQMENVVSHFRKKSILVDRVFIFFANYGPAMFFLEMFLLIAFVFARHVQVKHALLSLLIAMMAAVTTKLIIDPIAHTIGRIRPFVTYQYEPLLAKNANDPSFPSNHAGGALALTTVLVAKFPHLGLITILLAVLVILSRLYTGLHYFFDLLAGGFVGFSVAMVYLWVMR